MQRGLDRCVPGLLPFVRQQRVAGIPWVPVFRSWIQSQINDPKLPLKSLDLVDGAPSHA